VPVNQICIIFVSVLSYERFLQSTFSQTLLCAGMSHHVVGYVPTFQRHLLKRMNGVTCSDNIKLMIVIRLPSGNLGPTLGACCWLLTSDKHRGQEWVQPCLCSRCMSSRHGREQILTYLFPFKMRVPQDAHGHLSLYLNLQLSLRSF